MGDHQGVYKASPIIPEIILECDAGHKIVFKQEHILRRLRSSRRVPCHPDCENEMNVTVKLKCSDHTLNGQNVRVCGNVQSMHVREYRKAIKFYDNRVPCPHNRSCEGLGELIDNLSEF